MRILAFYFLITWHDTTYENGPFWNLMMCEEAHRTLERAAKYEHNIRVWRCVAK